VEPIDNGLNENYKSAINKIDNPPKRLIKGKRRTHITLSRMKRVGYGGAHL
jgi:hypothetical protein